MHRMTSRSPVGTRRSLLGTAAVILLLIVVGSYREWRQYSRANADAAQSREIADSVAQVLSDLTDAETGQRGFLLTGENRYLEPYNQALQTIPNQLSVLKSRVAARPSVLQDVARLNDLAFQKLAELRQTIELRRTEGAAPAIAVVRGNQGKRTMDAIRALCAEIQGREKASQKQISMEGEAAAQTALLATVMASLVLLFLFAVRLDRAVAADPLARQRPWLARYGAAILAAAAALGLRMALTPLIGPTDLAFSISLPAVLFAAWFGGLGPGAVCVLLSGVGSAFYFTEPVGSFLVRNRSDQISSLIFVMLGFGIMLLGGAQRRAVERAARAQDAERIERQRFETTLVSIGDAVIATDAQGRVTFANRVALSILRWPEREIAGKPLDEVFRIINEQSRATVESPVDRVLREGDIVGLANHTVLIARDGTEVPIDDSAAPIRGAGGTIQGTVLVFRDITERRRTEAARHLLASIVESSDDAIISKDLNGVVTSWNKGAERMFGYSSDEMIGHSISVLIPPGRVDETQAMLERVAKGEQIVQYETMRRTKSGKLINVSITWSPVYEPTGRIVGASKIVRDITARRQAEERFHLAVEAAPNGMLITDEAGKIILVNSQIERLFGYSREELIGQPVEMLVPHEHRDSHSGYRQAFFAAAQSRLMGEGRDLYGRRKDGSEFPIEVGLNPIDTRDGRWVLGAILDITERKRIEEQRVELAAKERVLAGEKALRDKDAELARIARALSVGELATSIAHEVNQPLAGVVTNAEACLRWLSGGAPNLEEAKQSVALIARDANRASTVIRRIREFLRKETAQTASLHTNDVIQETVALTRAELVKRRVELRTELSGDLPLVRGDRIQLQQVILNLIMNGAEAMAAAPQPKELLVTSRKSAEGGVLVAVRDAGAGISPQQMPRIFEAFFTTKPMGMGMGLSICRSIVEAHGGRIWAKANHGPGITVQFSLPAESAGQESQVAGRPS